MIESSSFRAFTAGAGSAGTPIVLAGAPETWDSGTADGQVGEYTATGAVYQWSAAATRWMRPESFNAGALTSVKIFDGTELQADWEAAGYTITTANGGAVASSAIGGRNYSILTAQASNGQQCYASRSGRTANSGVLYQGWNQVIGAGFASASHCMIPYLRNGKLYWFNGAPASTQSRWSNSSGAVIGMQNTSAGDMQSAPVWGEFLAPSSGGTGLVWLDHSVEPVAAVAGNQCSTATNNDEFIGDSSGTAMASLAIGAGFGIWDIAV